MIMVVWSFLKAFVCLEQSVHGPRNKKNKVGGWCNLAVAFKCFKKCRSKFFIYKKVIFDSYLTLVPEGIARLF